MPRFLPDTSCLVATICGWHEHHVRAVREFQRRLDRGEEPVIAAPALVETYAVLTRLPPPHRLSPVDALTLIDANFLGGAVEVVALDATSYQRLLRDAPQRSIAGGMTYDAVIVACGQAAQVQEILTFNERQFRLLASPGIEIVVPS